MPITSMKAHMEPVYIHHQSSAARPRVLQPLSRRISSHRFAGD